MSTDRYHRVLIAIATLAVVLTAACASDATTEANTASTISRPTPDPTTAVPATVALPSTAVTPSTRKVTDVPTQLQNLVAGAVDASPSIPGLVLRVEAPERHLHVSVAAGVADRSTATPLTPANGLRIASNTKTFTAAAVLRLVEQGILTLDASIGELLAPETVAALVAGGYRPDQITVRQLLLHTSGIYNYGTDPAYQAAVSAEPAKRWSRLEQVRFAMDHGAPVAEPGNAYAYSDTGYILLGEIIERATGTPMAQAYRGLLDFDGLHLDDTYFESLEPPPAGVAPRAHQYWGELDGFDLDPSFDLYGAAGLVSTVGDLATFYRALLRGDVFTQPETLATMLEIPASNTDIGAGMGIFRIDLAGNTCWSHSGFWGTFVLTCPEIDVTMAASWNQAMPADDFDPERVTRELFWAATAP